MSSRSRYLARYEAPVEVRVVSDEYFSLEHTHQVRCHPLENGRVLHHVPGDVRQSADKRRNRTLRIDERLEHIDDLAVTDDYRGDLRDLVVEPVAAAGSLRVDDDIRETVQWI